jgi:hypothetical protein
LFCHLKYILIYYVNQLFDSYINMKKEYKPNQNKRLFL